MKARLKKLLPKSTFARGVSVLVGGTAGSQALVVLAAPLLTRLYNPEDFGLLAVYTGLLALFSVVASLRYEMAIPLPASDTEAANVLTLSLLVTVLITGISGVMVILAGPQISQALGSPDLTKYFWLLPLGVFLTGAYKVFNYWAMRTKAFGDIASTRLSQSLVTLAIQIVGYKFGGIALLFGQAGGQGIGSVRLARNAFKHKVFQSWSWQGVLQAATRYKQFPIFSTWEGLLNTAGTQLPPLLFAALFSPAAAGLYSLANRILSLPMTLIGSAIGQVFFSSAAEAHRDGRLGKLVEQLHAKLAHVGLPPAILLILAGPQLFSWVFGADWQDAGEFARWMTPWIYLVFVSSPLSTLFAVMEHQKQGMMFQIILLAARVVALAAGAVNGSLLFTVILFSTASAVCWFGFLVWIGYKTGNPLSAMIRPTLEASVYAIACGLPLLAALLINIPIADAWMYGLALSAILVTFRLLHLLRKAY